MARLLNHYWTANDHPAIRQAQIEDWLDSLAEFPIEITDEACREWRNTQSRKPTIADIRILAIAEQRRAEERKKPKLLPPTFGAKQLRTLRCWEPGYAACYDKPWFKALTAEQQRTIQEQDLERAQAYRDSEQEYIKCCERQIRENLERMKLKAEEINESLAELRASLGVSAEEIN